MQQYNNIKENRNINRYKVLKEIFKEEEESTERIIYMNIKEKKYNNLLGNKNISYEIEDMRILKDIRFKKLE